MFDSLKKKLSNAIKGLVKREEQGIKAEEKVEAAQAQPAPPVVEQKARPPPEIRQVVEAPRRDEIRAEPEKRIGAPQHHVKEVPRKDVEQPRPQPKQEPKPEIEKPRPQIVEVPLPKVEKSQPRKEPEKRESLLKVSLGTKIKGVVFRSVTLNDSEISDFTENVKMSLLESDVSYETTEHISSAIEERLKTSKIPASNIDSSLKNVLRESLMEVLKKNETGIDVFKFVAERTARNEVPVKILFLGPNGTGKTTTMAKIAHHLKKSGITCVMSASDTFRAAAIEQTEYHANKIGVPVIKSNYGADPASIAFDAIAYAKAHGIQVVLIDSAGRQETNKNLINEIQKMVRIAKPDLTVFIGESTAGNALSEQIREFNKFAKIDGVVLSKLDCDAKGGNAISIADTTGIPILFFGVGEAYDAIMPYSTEFILNAIVPN